MGTINHIRVARSNWAIARECERDHRSSNSELGDEFPFYLRGKTSSSKPKEHEWDTSKKNVCNTCFEAKSVNGSCGCDW